MEGWGKKEKALLHLAMIPPSPPLPSPATATTTPLLVISTSVRLLTLNERASLIYSPREGERERKSVCVFGAGGGRGVVHEGVLRDEQ